MTPLALEGKITLNSTDFATNLKKAANTFTKALGGAAKLGAKAIGVASAAATAFGVSAIKTGMEFDSAMSQVAATLGYTTDDIKNNIDGAGDAFDALREKAKQMGSETNFTASQAAEGLNILAMSGYDAQESIGMIEDVLHLAAAGNMDLASAAGYVSGAMKGFADDTKSAQYYADLMAKGATLANTNVQQLGEAMSAGAAGAAAYSQSADSMTLALLRLAEQGEVGSAAGTALSAAMKNLYTPTTQAKKALNELGVSAYDSNGKARDFNDVVNELDKSLNAVGKDGLPKFTEEQKAAYKQTIFGIQGLDAYNKMTVTGVDKQKEWAEALSKASDGAGEAAKQYGTMTDNLQGDIDILNSAIDGFKIAVSDKFMGSARDIVQYGSNAISQLTEAFESGGIEGAVEKLGELLTNGLEKATAALPSAIKIGTTLLTSIVNGVVKALPTLVAAVPDIVKSIYDGVMSAAPSLIDTGKTLFEWVLNGLKTSFPEMIPIALNALMEFSGNLLEMSHVLVESGLELVMALADGIIENIPVILETVPTIISNIANIINDNMPTIFAAGIEILGKLVEGIISNIPVIVAEFPKIVTAIFNVITAVNWLNLGSKIITGIKNGVTNFASQLPQTLKKIGDNAWNALKNINWATVGQNIISFIANGISGLASNIPTVLKSIGTRAFTAFKSINWINLGANIVAGIASGISRGAKKVVDAAKNMAKRALNAAKDFLGIESPSKVFRDQVGKMMAEGMAQGFNENLPIQDMQSSINGLVRSINPASESVSVPKANTTTVIEVPLILNDRGLREIARSSVTYNSEELARMTALESRMEGII